MSGRDIDVETVNALAHRLPGSGAAEQRRIIGEIIRLMEPQMTHLSTQWAARNYDDARRDRHDALQEAWLGIVEQLQKHARGELAVEPKSWPAILIQAGAWRAREYYESSSVTGVTGAVSLTRRRKWVARAIDEARFALHREPTAAEVVETHNARMRQARSNPEKQGVLLTADEVRPFLR